MVSLKKRVKRVNDQFMYQTRDPFSNLLTPEHYDSFNHKRDLVEEQYAISTRTAKDRWRDAFYAASNKRDKIYPQFRDYSAEKLQEMAEKAEKNASNSIKNSQRLEKVRTGTWRGLSGKATATAALVGLIGGSFFYSTKITGNVVGMSTQTSSLIGVGLLIVGIIAGFAWVKNKK